MPDKEYTGLSDINIPGIFHFVGVVLLGVVGMGSHDEHLGAGVGPARQRGALVGMQLGVAVL